MPKVKVYNLQGKVVKELALNPAVFGVEIKEGLVHRAVVAQLANQRVPLAHTKDRSEVRGGGIKPWRQKGTGRARHGSIRSPIWRGGGVVFGPRKERNFSLKINKKEKRKALFMVLSDKVKNGNLVLLERLDLPRPKTRDFVSLLKRLPLQGKKVLVVLENLDEKILRASRNIERVKTILADSLNVVDLLDYPYLLMPISAIKIIEKTYLSK